jgi:2-C-methyl-D-erythritol 2,4-cyclodiphosphate synthase
MDIRIGQGYDVHAFAEGRELWLGGIKIPYEQGLDGHSDADVLLHAICDALLGALALGDIGHLFPNTDQTWKGADSKKLLAICHQRVADLGYSVVNLDCTLLLEAPKIMPYAVEIRSKVAEILHIGPDRVSLKATTSEKLGFIGRKEGACALAVVLLQKTA